MRKIFLASIIIFVACLPGIALADEAAADESIPYGGRLVKSYSHSAVYYIDQAGCRHAFPNEKIYSSWFSDFSQVEEISAFDLAGYPLGKNIVYRPGSRLIKIPSVPEVYAVEPGGLLRNIPSEKDAATLYGDAWATYIDDLDIAFFFDYNIGGIIDIIDGTPIFPVGTVVTYENKNYIVDKRTDGILLLREITDKGWDQNNVGLMRRYILSDSTVREFMEYGLPLILPEPRFSCTHCDSLVMNKKFINDTYIYNSDNRKYSFELPQTWSAVSQSDDPVVIAQEGKEQSQEDGYAENMFVVRWDAAEYDFNLKDVLKNYELAMAISGYDVYYSGDSNYHQSGVDAVSVSPEGYVNWSHYELKGETIYQIQFTSWLDGFGSYTDVLHLILTSASINPMIKD